METIKSVIKDLAKTELLNKVLRATLRTLMNR